MTIKQKFWMSGIWFLPISVLFWFLLNLTADYYNIHVTSSQNLIVMGICLLPIPYLFCRNLYEYYFHYRDDFDLKSDISWRSVGRSKQKLKALFKRPESEYLFKKPAGIVLGKTRNRYICVPIDRKNIMAGIKILGSPGSGKSAGPAISTLAYGFSKGYLEETSESERVNFYVIDIKGELHTASIRDDDERARIIDPNSDDENAYGYDAMYSVSQQSTDDEVVVHLTQLSEILIVQNNEKNAFFSNSARSIFVGVQLYFFRKQVWTSQYGEVRSGFSDAMKELLEEDTSALIQRILEDKG